LCFVANIAFAFTEFVTSNVFSDKVETISGGGLLANVVVGLEARSVVEGATTDVVLVTSNVETPKVVVVSILGCVGRALPPTPLFCTKSPRRPTIAVTATPVTAMTSFRDHPELLELGVI
jgi:hypothetical protein